MPAKSNPFTERAPAIRAIAECGALLRELNDAALLPTKQYNNGTEARRQKWEQLALLAREQAQRTSAPPVRKAPRKIAAVPATSVATGAQGETEQKTA